ncbi:MAG: M1 family aminopeptidase [Bacteroidia bacterium]
MAYRANQSAEDITYLAANWTVNPAEKYISGSIAYSLTILQADYDSLRLDLSDSLMVDSVRTSIGLLPFTQAEDQLRIDVTEAIIANRITLEIFYRGTPPTTGFGSFVQTNTPYAKPIIWTLSQPFGASDWWPCKEGFEDKIDSSDYYINIPFGNRAAGMGVLEGIDTVDNRQIYHWKHRYPIATYLVALAVTDYSEIKRTVPLREGNLELLNYCYPEHFGEWDWQQTEVMNMLQYFDSLFVPYPFMREKYGHAQFSWGGGMEHQTMSFMADLGPWLTSHELAHMWFGDMITCSAWKDIWLNEGFATYLTGLFFERFSNPSFFYWKRNNRDEICSQPGGSVRVDDTASVNRIFDGRLSYYKGAMILHMLRKKLGDNVFFEGMRNYLNRLDLRYNYANTEQFRETMQEASGINLQRYFDEWYAGEGYPNIRIDYTTDANRITLEISQQGSSTVTPLFETRVPIRILGETDSLEVNIDIRDAQMRIDIPLDFTPISIKTDPEADFLARYTAQKIEAAKSWLPSPNPIHKGSVLELPAFGKNTVVELITLDGKQIITLHLNGKQAAQVPIGNLAAGVYWIRLVQDSEPNHTKRLILVDK